MMETLTTINQRRAIRSYTGVKPSDEQLTNILTAAESAPVAVGQFDRYHLTVIEDPAILQALEQATATVFHRHGSAMLYGAPVFILVSANAEGSELSNSDYSSAAILTHTMVLAAVDQGIAACYIWGAVAGLLRSPEALSKLHLPAGFVPTCGLVLGQSTEKYGPRDVDTKRVGITRL